MLKSASTAKRGEQVQHVKKNMFDLKLVRGAGIKNQRVFLRVDFNTPLKDGKILDDFKVAQSLPTIKYLLKNGNKVIVASHLGRPAGKVSADLSLLPFVESLTEKLKGIATVKFIPGKYTEKFAEKIKNEETQVIILENLRFNQGEETNRKSFSKLLATFADVYVNDAFAVSHRACSSIVGIAKHLSSFAGLNFELEVKNLTKLLEPKRKAVALIGGAKVETKLPTITKLIKKYNYIMIAGGVGNTALMSLGYDIGGSLCDEKFLQKIKPLTKSKNLLVPIDVVVADRETRKKIKIVIVGKEKKLCEKDEEILDIGPQTIRLYAEKIKEAKTIVWAGTVGYAELKSFSCGSVSLAKIIAARASGRAFGVVGGGETLSVIHATHMAKYFDFISTGGGAMLEFLEGRVLPGIKVLIKK